MLQAFCIVYNIEKIKITWQDSFAHPLSFDHWWILSEHAITSKCTYLKKAIQNRAMLRSKE